MPASDDLPMRTDTNKKVIIPGLTQQVVPHTHPNRVIPPILTVRSEEDGCLDSDEGMGLCLQALQSEEDFTRFYDMVHLPP